MRKAISLLLSLCIIIFSACSQKDSAAESDVRLYYVSTEFDENNPGIALVTETLQYEGDGQPDVGTIIGQMVSGPKNSSVMRSPVYGIELINWSVTENTATLTFAAGYGELQGLERTFADACVTLTLLQLDYLTGVAVTWIGSDENAEMMTEQSFSLNQEWGTQAEQEITLYYASNNERYLVSESQTLVVEESESVERYVVEELIRGPKDEKYGALIPDGTELLDIYTEKGTCYVNLSAAFLTAHQEGSLVDRLAVYSVVNSLTGMKNVEKVQLLINGEIVGRYGLMDISVPLLREEQVIVNSQSSYDARDISVYVHYNGTDCVTEMPAWVRQEEYSAIEQLVVEKLLYMDMPQGCEKLFPDNLDVVSIAVRSGVCYVDMTEELLNYEDEESMKFGVYAVVASLTDLDNIDAVVLTIDNERVYDAPFDISGQFAFEDVVIG